MDTTSGIGEVWGNGSLFCTECLTDEPHFDGPNGIAYAAASGGENICNERGSSVQSSDFLIVALGASSSRILKVNASSALQDPREVLIVVNESVAMVESMVGVCESHHVHIHASTNNLPYRVGRHCALCRYAISVCGREWREFALRTHFTRPVGLRRGKSSVQRKLSAVPAQCRIAGQQTGEWRRRDSLLH